MKNFAFLFFALLATGFGCRKSYQKNCGPCCSKDSDQDNSTTTLGNIENMDGAQNKSTDNININSFQTAKEQEEERQEQERKAKEEEELKKKQEELKKEQEEKERLEQERKAKEEEEAILAKKMNTFYRKVHCYNFKSAHFDKDKLGDKSLGDISSDIINMFEEYDSNNVVTLRENLTKEEKENLIQNLDFCLERMDAYDILEKKGLLHSKVINIAVIDTDEVCGRELIYRYLKDKYKKNPTSKDIELLIKSKLVKLGDGEGINYITYCTSEESIPNNTNAIIVCYDMNKPELDKEKTKLKKLIDDYSNVLHFMLIGCNSERSKDNRFQLEKKALRIMGDIKKELPNNKLRFDYAECSAKTGDNVEGIFIFATNWGQ